MFAATHVKTTLTWLNSHTGIDKLGIRKWEATAFHCGFPPFGQYFSRGTPGGGKLSRNDMPIVTTFKATDPESEISSGSKESILQGLAGTQQNGESLKVQPWKVIEPPRRWVALNVVELWQFRDLLQMLIWRDISAKYRQSVVGYGWVFIKSLISIMIFTVVFGGLGHFSSDGVPYPLFALAALIPWTYFSNSLASVSSSVVSGAGLLTKVYFPRLILPLASLGAGIVDLGLQLVLLAILGIWYGYVPGWEIFLLPFFVLFAIGSTLAFGLWLTALNVKYRDVGQAVPFLLQALMWLSPVIYSSRLVPEKWKLLYTLNPLVSVIDGFRWTTLGTAPPDLAGLTVSVTTTLIILFTGIVNFRRQEAGFADII